jgi:ethanolamine utilization protein EutN
MHLGRVMGTVVATVKSPSLHAQRLLVVRPYTYQQEPDGDAFVAVDLVSAGRDEWVFYVKGREAANALADKFNPSDRAILGIVDAITLEALPAETPPGFVAED